MLRQCVASVFTIHEILLLLMLDLACSGILQGCSGCVCGHGCCGRDQGDASLARCMSVTMAERCMCKA